MLNGWEIRSYAIIPSLSSKFSVGVFPIVCFSLLFLEYNLKKFNYEEVIGQPLQEETRLNSQGIM